MFFSIFLTLVIFAFIISFTGGEETSLWIALGLLYVLFFNNKNAQIDKLNAEIEKLKRIVGAKDELPKKPAAVEAVKESIPITPKKPAAQPAVATKPATISTSVPQRMPMPTPHKESGASFLGQNLIVWIAGFAAILGAFYLIRYSVEHGILGPQVRFMLTVLFGLALTFTGYGIYGKDTFANNKRIGQALTGAGLTTLYFAAYAISEIYHFASQGMSFVLMCVVTGMAVILTIIRGGRPIALLTMLGAFLTPALVGNEQASPCFFSLYMLLFAGVFAWMAVATASVLLLVLALVGLYLWGFYWLFWGDGTLISLWQMIMLFGAATIFLQADARLGAVSKTSLRLPITLGCFFFGFGYVIRMKFGIMEWAVIGVMTAGLTALTFRDMKNYLPLLAGSVIAGLVIWTVPQQDKNLAVFAGYAAVALLPFYGSLWIQAKAVFSAYVGIFALLFYTVYCHIFLQGETPIHTFVGLFGAVMLLLPMFRYKLDTTEMQQAAGICLLAAAVMAAVALSKLFDADVLPLIAASGVLLFAAVGRFCRAQYTLYGLGMAFVWFVYLLLKPIAFVMAFLFIGPVWKMSVSIEYLSFANILTYGLLPLICFGGAMFMLPKREPRRVMFFSVAVLVLGSLFALYARGVLAVLGSESYRPGFTVHALITDLLLASYWFVIKKNGGSPVLSGIGFWRLGLVCLALFIGQLPFGLSFWGLIIGFGVALGLFIWFALLSYQDRGFLGRCALLCSFYFVTLLITLALSGGETSWLFAEHTSDSGIFVYSAGWMLLGICWLAASKFDRKIAKPAFVLIYFVIAKVFLYDVAELSDFWRIIALFALAGSLLGIGHFHARFFKENAS